MDHGHLDQGVNQWKVARVRPFIGILAIALFLGLIVAIALTPPELLYASGALLRSGRVAPPNVVPSPDWGAGILTAVALLVVLGGILVVTRRRRATSARTPIVAATAGVTSSGEPTRLRNGQSIRA
jgi:hypothetical protein